MTAREKVIKGLECCDYCNSLTNTCFQCPYLDLNKEEGMVRCTAELAHDALAPLREQEAVKPISAHVWAHTFGRCGNCEAPLPALEGLRSKFCWMCGKAVKWDA